MIVQPGGVRALVQKLLGDDAVDDRAREEGGELVGGAGDVHGEGLELGEEEVEAGFAARARDHPVRRERAEKLRRHLPLARPAVQRGDDAALHDHGLERVRAERGSRGFRGGEARERRSRRPAALVRSVPRAHRPAGTAEELAEARLDVVQDAVGEILADEALALALEVREVAAGRGGGGDDMALGGGRSARTKISHRAGGVRARAARGDGPGRGLGRGATRRGSAKRGRRGRTHGGEVVCGPEGATKVCAREDGPPRRRRASWTGSPIGRANADLTFHHQWRADAIIATSVTRRLGLV